MLIATSELHTWRRSKRLQRRSALCLIHFAHAWRLASQWHINIHEVMGAHPVPEHDVTVSTAVNVVQRHGAQLVHGGGRERSRRNHSLVRIRQDAACNSVARR